LHFHAWQVAAAHAAANMPEHPIFGMLLENFLPPTDEHFLIHLLPDHSNKIHLPCQMKDFQHHLTFLVVLPRNL